MANGPMVCVQTGGPLAINLLKLHIPARWAGLGKSLGLRPEIPETLQLQNALVRDEFTGQREPQYNLKAIAP